MSQISWVVPNPTKFLMKINHQFQYLSVSRFLCIKFYIASNDNLIGLDFFLSNASESTK